ncbi:FIG00613413: hypothetical protein [hydrothermal vent metagenome]|uniref:Uncharacterized protein n=1 Tax=hydrothermal vent metagenome TaxID=652676 RepID=A0A3B0ZX63_9ZZZZ
MTSRRLRESVTIPRESIKNNEAGFAELKMRGVNFAQEISGNIWSDYNAHDPGVTILEQLCYAITDLVFRADVDVAGFLTNEEGLIDYSTQSLHFPEEIFPCRPTTATDFRKILLDEIKEIDNLWLFVSSTQTRVAGLYEAEIKSVQKSGVTDKVLIEKTFNTFNQYRNLCEDLVSVTILKDRRCTLHAKIEIESNPYANELLAEIYFKCNTYISGSSPFFSYEERLAQGWTLEQLFDGPRTQHGLFDVNDDDETVDDVLIPTLFSIINSLSTVDHIKSLSLEVDGQHCYEGLPRREGKTVLSLDFPAEAWEVKVELIRNGEALPISIDTVKKCYQVMCYRRDSMREVKQNFAALYKFPKGKESQLDRYTSIQEHFPAIYGINRYGVSSDSTAAVAQARQLKSYLLIFEQVMANFTATCAQLRTLYSTNTRQRQTYAYQVIDESVVAEIDLLYPERPGEAIAEILSKYDHYFERKGRVLDYLLALYGQKFTQKNLVYFNYYYRDDELDEVIVNNKIACLESIIQFERDRASGFNKQYPVWNTNNIAGMQYKLCILLGFRHRECRSLTLPLAKLGLKVINHGDYRRNESDRHELRMIDLEDIKEHIIDKFCPVTYAWRDEEQAVIQITDNLEVFVPLKNNMVSDALLQGGVDLNKFRVGSLAPGDDYLMVFKPDSDSGWWYIGRSETRQEAEQNVLFLNRFLIALNIESEGLHLLEHVLLRPQQSMFYDDMPGINQEEFYSLRITVVFPAWTARCNDSRFRRLAEERVRNHCPAHILADIYWLDFDTLFYFETHYKCWLDACAESQLSQHKIDEAAKELILFLHNLHENDGDE